MEHLLAISTYVAYVFIIVMYTRKALRYARMPPHLRWDLYPRTDMNRVSEDFFSGGQVERATPCRDGFTRSLLRLLKDNFLLGEYYHRNRGYWLFLFPWHYGFLLIITLHILCFFAALLQVLGISTSLESGHLPGKTFYYAILFTGVTSFLAGSFGSVGMLIKRFGDRNLRTYASPMNYFNYFFLLAVFLTGWVAWAFADPDFSEYREFWKGLITFRPTPVEPLSAVHILLFAALLVYLPFTHSMHYITRFFAFFWVRWDDAPNVKGSSIEKRSQEWLGQEIRWSATHAQSGKKWTDLGSD